MLETTPLIKAALNLRVGVGFDVYDSSTKMLNSFIHPPYNKNGGCLTRRLVDPGLTTSPYIYCAYAQQIFICINSICDYFKKIN